MSADVEPCERRSRGTRLAPQPNAAYGTETGAVSVSSGERGHLAAMIAGARERGDEWAVIHWQAELVSREAYHAEYARLVDDLRAASERREDREPASPASPGPS